MHHSVGHPINNGLIYKQPVYLNGIKYGLLRAAQISISKINGADERVSDLLIETIPHKSKFYTL